MRFQTGTTSRILSQGEAEDDISSISHLISTLRTAFLTSDFDRVAEKLIARETKLKREIIKLKSENEMLEEKHQFDRLAKLNLEEERNAANKRYGKLLEEVMRGVGSDDKVTLLELRRKNNELESEKKKLEALLHSNFTRWENGILRLEKDIEELMNERCLGSRKMRGRRGYGGMIVDGRKDNCSVTCSPVTDLENVVELNENGSMAASAPISPLSYRSHSKGNRDQQNSGAGKFSSGGAVYIVDSDDDCAPRENSGSSGVQKKPKFLKRKCPSSLSSGHNENGDDNFEEMKQHFKLNLEPCGSKVNHNSEAGVTSTTNDPSSRDLVNLRQAEEETEPEQKSSEFIRPLAEARVDCDIGSSSSSSSYSEDGSGRQLLYSYAMQKIKERNTLQEILVSEDP